MNTTQDLRQADKRNFMEFVARGGAKPISRNALPKNANFIDNQFVLTLQEPGTKSPRYKARWILHGHQDSYRLIIANDSPMMIRMMFRVIVSLAVIFFNCNVWTRDVEQAYMQTKLLQRDLFTEPPTEANLGYDTVLKIKLPQYGVVKSC